MQNLVALKQQGRIKQITVPELREMFFGLFDKKYISVDDNLTGQSIMVVGDTVIDEGKSKPAEILWSDFCKTLNDSNGFVTVYDDGQTAPRYFEIKPLPELMIAEITLCYFDII